MSFLDYSRYAPIHNYDQNIDNYYKLDTMSKNGQWITCETSFGGSYPLEISTDLYELNNKKNMYMLSNGNGWMINFEANMRQNTIIRNVENGNPNNPNNAEPITEPNEEPNTKPITEPNTEPNEEPNTEPNTELKQNEEPITELKQNEEPNIIVKIIKRISNYFS